MFLEGTSIRQEGRKAGRQAGRKEGANEWRMACNTTILCKEKYTVREPSFLLLTHRGENSLMCALPFLLP